MDGELVSGNYFDVLGVPAAFGRLISPADDSAASAGPVAVLSYRFFQRRYAGDPSALGTTIRVDGHDFTVIGVTGEPFAGIKVGSPRDVWVPLVTLRRIDPNRGAVRPAPGVVARDVRKAQTWA